MESEAGDIILNSKNYFVHEWVGFHAHNTPAHPAVVSDHLTLNYALLNTQSDQVASFLLEKKIRLNDTVVVIMERTPSLMSVMLGIFKAGGIFVPVNPKYPSEKIRFIIEDSQTHLIITDNLQRLPEEYLYKATLFDHIMNQKSINAVKPPLVHDDNAVAYIIYTSGTTGKPKGVMIRHNSLVNLVENYRSLFNITAQDRASQFASQGFDPFFCETIPFFFIGASVHIVDDHTRLTPSLFFNWLSENKITICDLPTSYAKILFSQQWPENHSLRTVKIGGEALSAWPDKTFSFDLWNIYGPTETTIEAIFACIARAGQTSETLRKNHPVPPIGKPAKNIYCYVVDKDLHTVPDGTTGELLIGGICLAQGYLNRPDITRNKFIENPFDEVAGARLYRTGDIVRRHSDGNFEFIGRIDNQIKLRGYRIELGEVETCIAGYPDVSEVVVLAKELNNNQKSLIAWLVPKMEKLRIPWQGKCLLSINDEHYIQAISDDISREGMCIAGISDNIEPGMALRINVTLPGSNDSVWLAGKCVWQNNSRIGIQFDAIPAQMKMLEQCIEYYLSGHNLMETLESASIKRNLKNALKSRLPEYMIPDTFCVLSRMPLTFNGKVDTVALPMPEQNVTMINHKSAESASETEKKLLEIWKKILHKPHINLSDNFFEIGGNSLLVAEFCMCVMEQFDITLPADIFFDRPYIPIIAEFIESKGENFTDYSPIQKQMELDAKLPDDILPAIIEANGLNEPRNILLTGAGGFLGIYLLKYLLAQTDAKIYCLIRKGGFESIAKRFSEQVRLFSLSEDISLNNRRIILISGDISLHQFNLPLELYTMMTHQTDCIYHCGAQVNTMSSYSSLRNSNVLGTREVIRFATTGKSKAVYYISTLSSAYKKDEKGFYTEVFPDDSPCGLTGGYALTKWVSEKLLTQAMNRGLPVQIFRSGYIMGDSIGGVTNTNDALLLLIKGCIQLGYAPNWADMICILPVDFVAHAIISITRHQPLKSSVYHLDNPTGLPWIKLIRWVRKKGYPMRIVSHQKWLRELSGIDQSNALYSFLPYYLSMTMPPSTPVTGMEKASAILKKIGLPYPEANDHLLQIYLNYMINSGFIPSPTESELSHNEK